MAQDVTQDPPVGATTEDINDEITTHSGVVDAHQAEYLDSDAVSACDGVVDAASVGGLVDGEFDASTLNGKAESSLSVDDASKLGGTAASSYALDGDIPTVPGSTGTEGFGSGYVSLSSDPSGQSGTFSFSVNSEGWEGDGIRIRSLDDGRIASGVQGQTTVTVTMLDGSTESNTIDVYGGQDSGVPDQYVNFSEANIPEEIEFSGYGNDHYGGIDLHRVALPDHSHTI